MKNSGKSYSKNLKCWSESVPGVITSWNEKHVFPREGEELSLYFLPTVRRHYKISMGKTTFQKELLSWTQGRLKDVVQCRFCKNTPWHILQGKCPEDSCMDPTSSSWQPTLEREQRAWGPRSSGLLVLQDEGIFLFLNFLCVLKEEMTWKSWHRFWGPPRPEKL